MGPKGMTQEQVAYWDSVFSRMVQFEDWKKYDRDNFVETYYEQQGNERVHDTTIQRMQGYIDQSGHGPTITEAS